MFVEWLNTDVLVEYEGPEISDAILFKIKVL